MKIGNLTKLVGLAVVALSAGCTSAPPAPQRVEIPIFAPCVKAAPQRPAYEFDKLPSTAPDGDVVLALARDWPRGRKYEGELESLIAGCLQIQNLAIPD